MDFHLDNEDEWINFTSIHMAQSEADGEDVDTIMERVNKWNEEREVLEDAANKAKETKKAIPVVKAKPAEKKPVKAAPAIDAKETKKPVVKPLVFPKMTWPTEEAKKPVKTAPLVIPKMAWPEPAPAKKPPVAGAEKKKKKKTNMPDVFTPAGFKFDLSGMTGGTAPSAPSAPATSSSPSIPATSATSAKQVSFNLKTRKAFEEKEEEYYNETLEAQQQADAANQRAAQAEARERQLKKEIDDLHKSQNLLTEQLHKLQEKDVSDTKEREAQASAKAELEERYKVATDEIANLYTELQEAKQQRYKAEDAADEKEALLAAMAQELKGAEIETEEQKVKAEEGIEAISELWSINQQFETIFEDLGSNLTIDDYLKHIRELQAGTVTRPRRDSQASLSSIHNTNGNRPIVKQRQVSIADELLRASDNQEDAVSDHSPLPEATSAPGKGPIESTSPKDLKTTTQFSPLLSARTPKNNRFSSISYDSRFEDFPEYHPPPKTVNASTQTNLSPGLPAPITNETHNHTHHHPTKIYVRSNPASSPWWTLLLLVLASILYMYLTREVREWQWANDVSRQYRGGMYYGGQPMNPLQFKVESWVGVKRGMLG